jgi:mono/diheme cytochrome c family protein
MKRLALLAALAAPVSALAESGLVVFHTQCSRCHGEDGRGSAVFTTPSFLTSTLTAGEMARVVDAGRGRMPAFRTRLSAEEIAAVAAYVKAGLPAK